MKGRKLVAWNLRRIRVQRDLSQDRLALEADVDRSYVGRVERALENPTSPSSTALPRLSPSTSASCSWSLSRANQSRSRSAAGEGQPNRRVFVRNRRAPVAERSPLISSRGAGPIHQTGGKWPTVDALEQSIALNVDPISFFQSD
ncbi:MAG: helix-turn-helix transcriptional regulator [Rhodoplanes sp.]